MLRRLRWVLARLVLVVSIAPVILLGPSIVDAPLRLWDELAVAAPLRPGAVAAPLRPGSGHAAATAGPCAGMAPRELRLARLAGPRVRLAWRAPARAHGGMLLGYRVLRSGRTVGQTHRRAMIVAVTPGRTVSFTVQARYATAPQACASTLRKLIAFRMPGPVAGLRVLASTPTGITIAWRAAVRGDAPVAGYRVWRDAAVAGQTSRRTFALRLSPARAHTVQVAAVDTRGHVGPLSATLVVPAREGASETRESRRPSSHAASVAHGPPAPPSLLAAERVTDTSATLAWTEGASEGAAVTGYLLSEDGAAVGVVHGLSDTLALASEREYTFTVRTMNAAGEVSSPSPELKVLTTHTAPPAPTGVSAGAVTSQSAVVSWSPSTAVSGVIVGYRVFRDGTPVGQTSATEMTLTNLTPESEYTLTVVAVDSLGAISPPSEPLVIHTAAPPPTHGAVQAYLLASTDSSFEDFEAHYQQIGVVYPTYYECGAHGAIQGHGDALITHWANARKVAVMPRINCQVPAYEEQILNEPAVTKSTIAQLAELCRSEGYAGVQIDFEGAPPSEREPFTAFVTALAERLHAQGEKLSTVVTAKYWNVPTGRAAMYNDAALSGPSDYVFVLDWGVHWSTSAPGSIDEMPWFEKVAEYTATMPNKSKFVLGMPLYGMDWPDGGGLLHPATALVYSEIVALENELGIEPEWESTAESPHFSYVDGAGVHHEVWYVDQRSLAARAAVADSLGLGIGLWRLGGEDQSIWELPALGGEG